MEYQDRRWSEDPHGQLHAWLLGGGRHHGRQDHQVTLHPDRAQQTGGAAGRGHGQHDSGERLLPGQAGGQHDRQQRDGLLSLYAEMRKPDCTQEPVLVQLHFYFENIILIIQ